MATEAIVLTNAGKSALTKLVATGQVGGSSVVPKYIGWGIEPATAGEAITESKSPEAGLWNEVLDKGDGAKERRTGTISYEGSLPTTNNVFVVKGTLAAESSRKILEAGLFFAKTPYAVESEVWGELKSGVVKQAEGEETTIETEANMKAVAAKSFLQIRSEIVEVVTVETEKKFKVKRGQQGTGSLTKKWETKDRIGLVVAPGPYFLSTPTEVGSTQTGLLCYAKANLASAISLNTNDEITWTFKITYT